VLAFSVIAGSLVLSILAALAIPRRGSRGSEAMAPAELIGAVEG
jgi:ABC-type spermidine/putrescine transport system permease subunit II